jgi:hypothetical protein
MFAIPVSQVTYKDRTLGATYCNLRLPDVSPAAIASNVTTDFCIYFDAVELTQGCSCL